MIIINIFNSYYNGMSIIFNLDKIAQKIIPNNIQFFGQIKVIDVNIIIK